MGSLELNCLVNFVSTNDASMAITLGQLEGHIGSLCFPLLLTNSGGNWRFVLLFLVLVVFLVAPSGTPGLILTLKTQFEMSLTHANAQVPNSIFGKISGNRATNGKQFAELH